MLNETLGWFAEYFLVVVCLLFGLWLISSGSRAQKRGELLPGVIGRPADGSSDWAEVSLKRWGIVHEQWNPGELASISAALKRANLSIFSRSIVGAGSALVIMAIGGAIVSLVTTGAPLSLDNATDGLLFAAGVYFCLSLGGRIGTIVGVWQTRRAMRQNVAYADLRQRSLADYRTPMLRWLPILLLLYMIGATVLLMLHPGTETHVQLLWVSQVPVNFWTVSIFPMVIILLFALIEIVLSRIARLPRLLVTPVPLVAQQVDDMLRARAIGIVQGFGLAAIAYLCMAQSSLLIQSSHFSPLAISMYILASGVMGGSFLVLTRSGRLGGKVIG